MIDEPHITTSAPLLTAVIRLTIPREQIQAAMGPAIGEVFGAVATQGIGPAGPVFSYHLRMDPAMFDFEVGVPVNRAVTPIGRVIGGSLPGVKVARTIHHGGYEGLGDAWGKFCEWIAAQGHAPAAGLWEFT